MTATRVVGYRSGPRRANEPGATPIRLFFHGVNHFKLLVFYVNILYEYSILNVTHYQVNMVL